MPRLHQLEKDGSKKISNEKKNNLLMSIFENFSLKIKKKKYGTINDIKLNINLTRFLIISY